MTGLADRLENRLGRRPVRVTALGGGSIAEVAAVLWDDGTRAVVKTGPTGSRLDIEGQMLDYLKSRSDLPVPGVHYAADDLLVMDHIEAGSRLTGPAQAHAADLLAALHGLSAPQYGFAGDTLIGGLAQPNPWTASWRGFFRDHRLMYMGHQALNAGRLPAPVLSRLERFCAEIERWIPEPAVPSLIHGDMWGGNVLCLDGRITGFIDPAIYYADAEIELAFSTLFSTFGEPFFSRYQEHRPLDPAFFDHRCDLYNLFPLLVHVRLFGGAYVESVRATLGRFGY